MPDKLGGSGADISFKTVNKWGEECLAMEVAMRDAGGSSGLTSVIWMAFHGYEFPSGASVSATKGALMALAVKCGLFGVRPIDS